MISSSVTTAAANKINSNNNPKHVHVTVTKDVPVESQEIWLNCANELARETWTEDGCISYDFVRSNGSPTRFVIIEEWESQKHLDDHFATPHFQMLIPLMDRISTTIELDVCSKALIEVRSPSADRFRRNGRILVLYDSSTGSTEAIASLIAEGVQLLDRIDVRIRVVPGPHTSWEDPSLPRDAVNAFATHSDIYWADALASGTPTNLGCVSYRMKQFWDDFSQQGGWGSIDGKIGTAFTSQGGHGGGGELACMAMQTILMNFGFTTFGITDYVGSMDTMHYGSCIAKKPRGDMDKMKCRRQGLRLAEFVAYYINGRDEANPMNTKEWENQRWGYPGIPSRKADPQELTDRTCSPHVSLLLKEGDKAGATEGTKNKLIQLLKKKKALIFTKMEDYVHDSTPAMAAWVFTKLVEFGWESVVTDESDTIESHEKLSQYDLVVFLNNSGQIFAKSDSLLAHIGAGKGVVGVHAAVASFLNGKDASGATIMEPTSAIFETIFGSHFQNHPPVQTGTIMIEHELSKNHLAPNMCSLPSRFPHTDEFFNFTKNVADDPDFHVVAWVDESSYDGGLMGERHPIAWYREMGANKARVFYSGLGHFSHFYNGTGPKNASIILEAGLRYCCGF